MYQDDDTAIFERDPDLDPEVEAAMAARLHALDPERWPMTPEQVRRRLGLDPGPNRLT